MNKQVIILGLVLVVAFLLVNPIQSLNLPELLQIQSVSPVKLQEKARSVFELSGVVYVARTSDGIEIGVTSKEVKNEVKDKLQQLGIPITRVKIVETEPIYELAKLESIETKLSIVQEETINFTQLDNYTLSRLIDDQIEKTLVNIKDYNIKLNSTPIENLVGNFDVDKDYLVGNVVYINITPIIKERLIIKEPNTPIPVTIEPITEIRIKIPPTLHSKVRPVVGGIEISSDKGAQCTLGFTAKLANTLGFVTNSHCSLIDFFRDGGSIYQPSWPDSIGVEILDPAPSYLTISQCNDGFCIHSNFYFRYSDAAFFKASTELTLGKIAKVGNKVIIDWENMTIKEIEGEGLTIIGNYTIVGTLEGNAKEGTKVCKVGRTTGMTCGEVIKTCVDVRPIGSDVIRLCQDIVSAYSSPGDSGSPVFKIENGEEVVLYGILWGGSKDGKLFVYSPFSNIVRDLGKLEITK